MAGLRVLNEDDLRRATAIAAYLDGFSSSPHTRRTAESALRSIARQFSETGADHLTLQWELAADPELYDEFARRIRASVSPKTAAKYMWALRGLLRHLARHGIADRQTLSATIEGTRTPRTPEGAVMRGLSSDEFAAMLRSCRHDPNVAKGHRDAAILALLGGAGPRRSEIASINVRDVDLLAGTVSLITKGQTHRTTALNPATAEHIVEWQRFHDARSGPLFPPVAKNGLVQSGSGISDKAIYRVVTQRRDEAGVDAEVTPHSFRRWFVTSLLDADVDLFTVMRAVGHRYPSTTQRYDRRRDAVVAAAINRLQVPTVDDLRDEP